MFGHTSSESSITSNSVKLNCFHQTQCMAALEKIGLIWHLSWSMYLIGITIWTTWCVIEMKWAEAIISQVWLWQLGLLFIQLPENNSVWNATVYGGWLNGMSDKWRDIPCRIYSVLMQKVVILNLYLRVKITVQSQAIPDSKVHWVNMGPTWVLLAPDGPHVGPMNLAIRDESVRSVAF